MALSTLRPTTSPRLSVIRLRFAGPPVDLPIKTLIKDTANDLRRVAGEVARIEREFEGAVNFTVLRDSVFETVLCALNVRIRFSWWGMPHVDSPSSIRCRSSSITTVELLSVVASSIFPSPKCSFCSIEPFGHPCHQSIRPNAGFNLSIISCTCGRYHAIHSKAVNRASYALNRASEHSTK